MTRRRFYAPSSAFAPDKKSVRLSADEARHARNVLRLQRGDEVYVFNGEGREYRCVIAQIERESAQLDLIEQVEPAGPESPLHLTLAVALLKGEKFDLVVQKATELGVSRIVPVVTARADVRPSDADDSRRRVTRWQRIALEAAKQSGRARAVEVSEPVAFDSLITNPAHDGELRLMFAERAGTSFDELLTSLESRSANLIALVGSEGGWTDEEIASARASGWKTVTLGGRILRAETAAIVVAALLQHRFGDLV
jgi:16S rRNA (uracil1498-N3)-methyltransferase